MSPAPTRVCSEVSFESGEPLAGTASDAPLFAAFSWPKALWHHDDVALSEGLPAAISELAGAAKRSGRKLQLRLFQRTGRQATDPVELICADFQNARTARIPELPLERCAAAISEFIAGGGNGTPLERPLLLVCTDGKHDLCCGKLGRSIVSALRSDPQLDVAEVSHLGGHRLAANCLALASGELYGRIAAADAPALAESIRHGRVYLPRYRGRTGLDELAQVAEAAALARFPNARRIRPGAPRADGDARIVPVELRDDDVARRLAVRCVARIFEVFASCGDLAPEPRARWVAQSSTEEKT